jgi:hypothetical protein
VPLRAHLRAGGRPLHRRAAEAPAVRIGRTWRRHAPPTGRTFRCRNRAEPGAEAALPARHQRARFPASAGAYVVEFAGCRRRRLSARPGRRAGRDPSATCPQDLSPIETISDSLRGFDDVNPAFKRASPAFDKSEARRAPPSQGGTSWSQATRRFAGSLRIERRADDAVRTAWRCSAVLSQTTKMADFRGFSLSKSPLTDSNRRPPPYHVLPEATGGSRWQWISLVVAVSRASRFAAGCHRLQPRGSIKAPSLYVLSPFQIAEAENARMRPAPESAEVFRRTGAVDCRCARVTDVVA